jgi:hypothetical protein
MLVLENGATWELSVIGTAKTSFTITAGSFSQTFSAEKLRAAVAPVLEQCGDHWRVAIEPRDDLSAASLATRNVNEGSTLPPIGRDAF